MPDVKIKKDGQEYGIGVIPQHYPADRVYLDGDTSKTVQDAIERGSVSVTADGIKTWRQLLNDLWALIDFSKISKNSKLVIDGTYLYNLSRISNSICEYTNTAGKDSSPFFVTSVFSLNNGYSIFREYSSNVNPRDSETVTQGRTISINY